MAWTAGVIVAALAARAEGEGLELRTGRPGNLFPHGVAVVVQLVTASPGSVEWRVIDFEGNEAGKGTVSVAEREGTIELGRLPRGYYELTARARGESGSGIRPESGKLALGVVTDHSGEDPPSGRLNVDGATAWLERDGRHETLARMLRMLGVGWIRERFSWGGTEPRKGEIRWQQYDTVADVFTKQGIRVYQIFHDSPSWSHGGIRGTRNPRDLRDVFRFARTLARHYRGRVRAWEVWNEPDIFFWPDLGDTFAGLQKAAYLGFKAGDPDLPVLLGSFCRGLCGFDESLFEAGIENYFDIFNWHIYSPPSRYADTLKRYLDLLARYGCQGRPVWLTEAGIRLPATEPGGELKAADERKQADFVPRSFARSLAAGTDRHFFFVYPYYLERGVQFGSLRKDLSPRPGLLAIAAAVDILGEARFLGSYGAGEGVTALAFDSGARNVLVVWSDAPREVELDVAVARVELASAVGRREGRETEAGRLKLGVGPSPQYIIGCGQGMVEKLAGQPRPAGKLPVTRPNPVVIRGQARVATIDKGNNCYLIGEDDFSYAVEVCNLDEGDSARGSLHIELPGGWKAAPREVAFNLEPMGRDVRELTITPGKPSPGTHRVWIRPGPGEGSPASSVSYFRFDFSRVSPSKSLDLGLDDPTLWRKNTSGNGKLAIQPASGGGVRFEVEFSGPGDSWCYPEASLPRLKNVSEFDGVGFEYRCQPGDQDTTVRLQVIEAGRSAYLTVDGWKAKAPWTRVACRFEDLSWGSYSPADADGKLDPGAIRSLQIGLNTSASRTWLEIRSVKLVRMVRK